MQFKVDQAVQYDGRQFRIFTFCELDGYPAAVIYEDPFDGAAPPGGIEIEERLVPLDALYR